MINLFRKIRMKRSDDLCVLVKDTRYISRRHWVRPIMNYRIKQIIRSRWPGSVEQVYIFLQMPEGVIRNRNEPFFVSFAPDPKIRDIFLKIDIWCSQSKKFAQPYCRIIKKYHDRGIAYRRAVIRDGLFTGTYKIRRTEKASVSEAFSYEEIRFSMEEFYCTGHPPI